MIYAKSAAFKYIERNQQRVIVLLPGWATDCRIFEPMNLKFNYLVPVGWHPPTFAKALLEQLKENNINKVSLLGWSLGGFAAAEFASKHANLVDELILISIRKKYGDEELAEAKKLLRENKKAYLYKFYNRCFFRKENMRWFTTNLLRHYCGTFDTDYLLDLLDYLGYARITRELLEPVNKITIIHGERDKIAPIQEAIDITSALGRVKFIPVKDAGHMLFLETDINSVI